MKNMCIVVALLGVLVLRADAGDVADDQKAIEGTWSVVYAVIDGNQAPAEGLKGVEAVVLGEKLTLGKDGKTGNAWQYRLDSSKMPKTINIVIETLKLSKEGDAVINGREKMAGIYELKGDELKIAWSKGTPLAEDAKDPLEADKLALRPSSFEHSPNVAGVLILKRVRK